MRLLCQILRIGLPCYVLLHLTQIRGTCANIVPKLNYTESIMALAPLHVHILRVGLHEFLELSILVASNILSYWISVSNTDYSEFLPRVCSLLWRAS
uniref:Putative secreted protein n=1 Tax=Ixodes ricinus TaxID=34613 RepID=A0A6B0UAK3_IXORI